MVTFSVPRVTFRTSENEVDFGIDFGPKSDQNEPKMESKIGPKSRVTSANWDFGASKVLSFPTLFLEAFWERFGLDFGVILESFW